MKIHKSSINNGIFLGIAFCICIYALYFANTRMFFPSKSWVLFVVFILITIKSGTEAKRAQGGQIAFKTAFFNMFITGAIGYLFSTIGEFILYNVVDPSMVDLHKELSIEGAEQLSEMMGGNYGEILDEQIEKIEDADNLLGLSAMLQQYLFLLFAPIALFSAIIALFMKTKNVSGNQHKNDEPEKKYIVNK